MYLFMYRYISSGYDTPLSQTLPPLFLCGLFFGLGVATKWTGFYAALGLVVLYVLYLVKRGCHQIAAGQKKGYSAFLLLTLAASVGFFVVIPFAIYTLSYLPYTTANDQPFTLGGLVGDMWHNQKFMLSYHSDPLLGSQHPYQSPWWNWMFDIRPMRYYYSISQDTSRTIIAAFTNPLVTIGGVVAMLFALRDFLYKKAKAPFVIVVGYLAQFVPWIFVSRSTFVYHYFPSIIFLILAICYVFKNLLERSTEHKWRVYAFTGSSIGLFFLLLPPTAGIPMPDWYWTWFARWLPSWPY